MFNWFNKTFFCKANEQTDIEKIEDDMKKVIPFPEQYVATPESPAMVYYRIGITDNNCVSLAMGYSEITMNKEGVQNLIDQLTVFMNQL